MSEPDPHALAQMDDASKFLELLLGDCGPGATDHAWRKCRRCLALAKLTDRDPLAVKLVTHALTALQAGAQALRSHEDADHGGTSLTEGAGVSVLVPAPQLPHDATHPFRAMGDTGGWFPGACADCGELADHAHHRGNS